MVKVRRPFLVLACLVLVSGFFASKVNADDWNKATVITTNQPIEVPGRVLPAGKYMFKLMDSLADRHIVQIMSDDQTKLYQTVLAIPDYRAGATNDAALTFYETPAGSVTPVRSWFYAGERSGVEFIYPKQRGTLLAAVSENIPPSQEFQEAVTEPTVTKAEPAPAILEKPAPESETADQAPTIEPESEVAQTTPEVAENTPPETPAAQAPEAAPPEAPSSLPKTASPDELFLLIGLGSAFAAWGARRLRS